MSNISIDLQYSGIKDREITYYMPQIELIHKELHKMAGDKKEFARMAYFAYKI